MKINWTVRIKNKAFWLAIIPALLLLAQQICSLFGIAVEVAGLSEQLISILGTVFAILTLLGVVTDPTTSGMSDSDRAMTYNKPN
jgi:phi LC3 family holin